MMGPPFELKKWGSSDHALNHYVVGDRSRMVMSRRAITWTSDLFEMRSHLKILRTRASYLSLIVTGSLLLRTIVWAKAKAGRITKTYFQ